MQMLRANCPMRKRGRAPSSPEACCRRAWELGTRSFALGNGQITWEFPLSLVCKLLKMGLRWSAKHGLSEFRAVVARINRWKVATSHCCRPVVSLMQSAVYSSSAWAWRASNSLPFGLTERAKFGTTRRLLVARFWRQRYCLAFSANSLLFESISPGCTRFTGGVTFMPLSRSQLARVIKLMPPN